MLVEPFGQNIGIAGDNISPQHLPFAIDQAMCVILSLTSNPA
tara:strand:- start:395 stop:520 length:126 start_codon:yes stop_codon:yes gene_type:complete